jgi:hypothetical protein
MLSMRYRRWDLCIRMWSRMRLLYDHPVESKQLSWDQLDTHTMCWCWCSGSGDSSIQNRAPVNCGGWLPLVHALAGRCTGTRVILVTKHSAKVVARRRQYKSTNEPCDPSSMLTCKRNDFARGGQLVQRAHTRYRGAAESSLTGLFFCSAALYTLALITSTNARIPAE